MTQRRQINARPEHNRCVSARLPLGYLRQMTTLGAMMSWKSLLYLPAFVVATGATAADLPSMKGPPPVPPPVFIWTGFYAGVIAGDEWSDGSIGTITSNVSSIGGLNGDVGGAVATQGTGSVPLRTGRFAGGGQVGYNYQVNSFVLGVAADIEGMVGSSGRNTVTNSGTVAGAAITISSTGTIASSRSLNYLGTARGRIGWLISPQILLFATGGLAYGGVASNTSVSEILGFTDTPPFGTSGSFSGTRLGWTVGGGGEWMFAPHWGFTAEYLYYDLGHVSYQLSPLNQFGDGGTTLETVSAVQSTTHINGNILRLGVNYHF
jgi:outer membrane immunogenic protein